MLLRSRWGKGLDSASTCYAGINGQRRALPSGVQGVPSVEQNKPLLAWCYGVASFNLLAATARTSAAEGEGTPAG